MKAVAMFLLLLTLPACLSFQDSPRFEPDQCQKASEMRKTIQAQKPTKVMYVSDAQKYAVEANRCERYLYSLYVNTVAIEKRNRCGIGCQSQLMMTGAGIGVLVGAGAIGAAAVVRAVAK